MMDGCYQVTICSNEKLLGPSDENYIEVLYRPKDKAVLFVEVHGEDKEVVDTMPSSKIYTAAIRRPRAVVVDRPGKRPIGVGSAALDAIVGGIDLVRIFAMDEWTKEPRRRRGGQ